MRRRWIADEHDADRAALTGANAEHLARVLRAKVGQEFDIAAGGKVRRGIIRAISEKRVDFDLGEELPAVSEPDVTLLLAVFKFDRFEWAVEKVTELGASRIVPLIARRTDAHLAKSAGKRVERWRRLAHEAAQQSRRVTVPEIADPTKFKDVVPKASGTRIVLAESEREQTMREAVTDAKPLSLAVGPEGGWTDDELTTFKQSGWISVSLGPNILRAETAAITATALAMAAIRERST